MVDSESGHHRVRVERVPGSRQPDRQRDVLGDRELIQEAERLGQDRHVPPGVRPRGVGTQHGRRAGVGLVPAGHDREQRGLPRAGPAGQCHDLTGCDREMPVVEDPHRTGGCSVRLPHTAQVDDRFRPQGHPAATRPSRRVTTWSAASITAGSCDATTKVAPRSMRRRMALTSAPAAMASSSAVGSSARSSAG
jgi:hypothetical protein